MMNKLRGFEVAKGFEDQNINLPIRKTKNSACWKSCSLNSCH